MHLAMPRARKPAKHKTPLPRFDALLCRAAAQGRFDQTDIKAILSDEFWFGSGNPRWKKATTPEKAWEWWDRGCKRLVRKPGRDAPFNTYATHAVINTCKPGNRCSSNACYLCTRAFQRWLVTAIRPLIRERPEQGYEDKAITFVYPQGQFSKNGLAGTDLRRFMLQTLKAIEGTGSVLFGFLAYDISFNDDRAKFKDGTFKTRPEEYWQVHMHGWVRTRNYEAVKAALKKIAAKSEKIRAPVHSPEAFNGSCRGISYWFKPTAFKRTTYRSKENGRWNARGGKVSAPCHVEYLVAAHALTIPSRIGLINLHPQKKSATPKRKGKYRLRKITPRRIGM